ncbi:MAG: hypothetical protein GWP60_03305 [Gammaproteobacteria bacterium]|nr:hypothetical protein [Gammaproteobacteria bacterium]
MRFSKLVELLGRFGLSLRLLGDDAPITGSFWGEPEAGIVGRSVFVRLDTPVHSLLHETCHVICMNEQRRAGLERDAGGDDIEEAAVCYLQVVLADYLPGVGRDRLMRDMDAWGYSFRLGSSRAWFDSDAEDARAWLLERKLLIEAGTPAFVLRKS